jgi:benzylsuccinate CoA-transferase BbsF subunit
MTAPPLKGIRVADFSWVWAGPYCTLQLAHLGAEVIRIETARRPCLTRMLPPWADQKIGLNRAGYFNQYNQGKRSMSLNLKHPAAVEVARRLIKKSDIVAHNFVRGVMERFGLGYEQIREFKPDVIMVALSGYGATGPLSSYISYGPAQVPLAGFSALTGYAGGPPMHTALSYADPNAGIHAAFAVLAALYHRRKTGQGQFLDLSLWECATALTVEGLMEKQMSHREPARRGNRDPWMAPHGVFRCRDLPEPIGGGVVDTWVSIAVANDDEWRRLCRAMAQAELGDDARFATAPARKRHEDELEAIITAWTSQRSPQEVTKILQEAGVAAFTCTANKDLAEDPHLNQRGFFVELEHPEIGARKHCGIPWRLSRNECRVQTPAPLLGQHTDEVLTGLLDYSAAEVTDMREAGALN